MKHTLHKPSRLQQMSCPSPSVLSARRNASRYTTHLDDAVLDAAIATLQDSGVGWGCTAVIRIGTMYLHNISQFSLH
jgi:hypothetical protein